MAKAVAAHGSSAEAIFAGRLIDEEFLASLPVSVDPCGERGEFHSFVFAGLSFKDEVRFTVGEPVFRDSFWFRDLVPEG